MAIDMASMLNSRRKTILMEDYLKITSDWQARITGLKGEFLKLSAIKSFDAETVIRLLINFDVEIALFAREVEDRTESLCKKIKFDEAFFAEMKDAARHKKTAGNES